MYLDHKKSGGQPKCERGYEQSGTDCAEGITPSWLFNSRSDLDLKIEFDIKAQQTLLAIQCKDIV